MRSEQGQVILILILVMTVALAIGISVIQRSFSDISTASKVEQSSRAFSAAEAGIEKVLSGGALVVDFSNDNSSKATVTLPENNTNGLIPAIPSGFNRQEALECPPGDSKLAKEDVAQVWLADPDPRVSLPGCTATGYSPVCYKQNTLDVYWGTPNTDITDKAALDLTIVYYGTDPTDPVDPSTPKYRSRKWYLDQPINRTPSNGFDQVQACNGVNTPPGSTISYQCYVQLGNRSVNSITNGPLPAGLMLLRARLLYNKTSQPFAVQAVNNCSQLDTSACIPPQAKVLVSKGTAGQTQRTIKVCQLQNVVPFYFDYAIFSQGAINKQ